MHAEVKEIIEVKEVIEKAIRAIAAEWAVGPLDEIKESTELVDEIGFSSVTMLVLTMRLEDEFGVDPFQDENVSITDIRTMKNLCDAYANRLARGH